MDNGNDPPACIPFLDILMKNMIPTSSGLTIAASILKIDISRNTNSENMVNFPKSGHILQCGIFGSP